MTDLAVHDGPIFAFTMVRNWHKTLEEAHALILRLLARIEEQDRRIAELERRLNQNSQNSSRPPSSDPQQKRCP